jgi:hypothetical protein
MERRRPRLGAKVGVRRSLCQGQTVLHQRVTEATLGIRPVAQCLMIRHGATAAGH